MPVDRNLFCKDYANALEGVRMSFQEVAGEEWLRKFENCVGPETAPVWLEGLSTNSYEEHRDSLYLNILVEDIARKYLRLPYLQDVLSVYATVAIASNFPYKQGNLVPVAAMFVNAVEEGSDLANAKKATREALETLMRPLSSTRAALEGRSALLKWPVCAVVEEEAPWLYEGWFGKVKLEDVQSKRTREASLTQGEPTALETQSATPFQNKFFVSYGPLLWMQEPSTAKDPPAQADAAFQRVCSANKAYISYVRSTATQLLALPPDESNMHGLADIAGALVEILVKAKSYVPNDSDEALRQFDVFELLRPEAFSLPGARAYARRIYPAAWPIEELRAANTRVPLSASKSQHHAADARREQADQHAQAMEGACTAFCAQMRTRALRTLQRQRLRNVHHVAAVGIGTAAALGLGYAAWTNRRPVATRSPRAAPARHEAPPVHSAARPPPAGQSVPSRASTQAQRGGS